MIYVKPGVYVKPVAVFAEAQNKEIKDWQLRTDLRPGVDYVFRFKIADANGQDLPSPALNGYVSMEDAVIAALRL